MASKAFAMIENWGAYTSIIFLAGLLTAVFALSIFALTVPGRYSFIERLLYAPVYTLARILWRVEIEWDEKWAALACESTAKNRVGTIENSGMLRDQLASGAVLIANHRSSVDPFFIQLAAGCRVHWMVAGEYFRHFLFGPLLRSYQAIPTNRAGMDNAATKRAIRLASEGSFVGMFPEGRINRTECALLSIRPGAALVASRAGVPLIPIWIEGAPVGPEVYSAMTMAAHVRVRIGLPCVSTTLVPQALEQIAGSESIRESTKLGREESKQWISQAMCELLRLGHHSETSVSLAGKKWVEE